jgi:hypothetical protein
MNRQANECKIGPIKVGQTVPKYKGVRKSASKSKSTNEPKLKVTSKRNVHGKSDDEVKAIEDLGTKSKKQVSVKHEATEVDEQSRIKQRKQQIRTEHENAKSTHSKDDGIRLGVCIETEKAGEKRERKREETAQKPEVMQFQVAGNSAADTTRRDCVMF